MKQYERLTIPIYNIGGAVTDHRLAHDIELIAIDPESLSDWYNSPFVARVVPESRRRDPRIAIRLTRPLSRQKLYENDRAMSLLYSAISLIGLANDSRVEGPFARYTIVDVDGATETEQWSLFLDHPFDPRLSPEIHPHNAVMFDTLSQPYMKSAIGTARKQLRQGRGARYALSRWYQAKSRLFSEDALVDAWIGLEGLYLKKFESPKSNMYPRLAKFLSQYRRVLPSRAEKLARRSYRFRNDVVHGDVSKARSLTSATKIALAILRESLIAIFFQGAIIVTRIADS